MKFLSLLFAMLISSSSFALGASAPNPEDNGKIQCIAKPMYSSRPSHSNLPVRGRPELNEVEARDSALNKCRRMRARTCHVVSCSVVGALSAEELILAE